MDWITETIGGAFDAVGDAFEWVGEKISEAWDNDLVKIAAIVAVGYFAFFMLPEMMAATATETAIAAETGILSAGATDLTLASSGMQLGSSAAAEGALMTTAEIVGTEAAIGGVGALEGVQAAAAFEGIGGTAAGVDMTMAGAGQSGIGMTTGAAAPAAVPAPSAVIPQPGIAPPPPPAETGVLDSMGAWAQENPMMAYGGMMAGGQAISGYMQGKQMEEMEKQRLAEEEAARNRQNVWGVNYGTGGEAISAGDRLKDLNRDYFDSSAPINPAVQDYQLASTRQAQGALDQVNSIANPTRKTYIN